MNPRILILEDDANICKIYTLMLKRAGFDSDIVTSGEQALAHYTSTRQSNTPYVAVILDLTVEQGMDGIETLAHLRKLDPDIYAIVASGTARETIAANYREQGFSDALPKPFRLQDILDCLNRLRAARIP